MEIRRDAGFEGYPPQYPPPAYDQLDANYEPPPPRYGPSSRYEHEPETGNNPIVPPPAYDQLEANNQPPPPQTYGPSPTRENESRTRNIPIILKIIRRPVIVCPVARPRDYLILCLLTFVFNFPLGIIALFYSIQSRTASDVGNFDMAKFFGIKARNLSITGTVANIIVAVILVIKFHVV